MWSPCSSSLMDVTVSHARIQEECGYRELVRMRSRAPRQALTQQQFEAPEANFSKILSTIDLKGTSPNQETRDYHNARRIFSVHTLPELVVASQFRKLET
jgi:hypothetical protein